MRGYIHDEGSSLTHGGGVGGVRAQKKQPRRGYKRKVFCSHARLERLQGKASAHALVADPTNIVLSSSTSLPEFN